MATALLLAMFALLMATTVTDRLLSESETAELLGVQKSTLAAWRCTGRYQLPYVKVGRLVRYRESDVFAWLEKRRKGNHEQCVGRDFGLNIRGEPSHSPAPSHKSVDSLFGFLDNIGWEAGLAIESYDLIIEAGISSKNLGIGALAAEIAFKERPLTLRGLFYQVVSVGGLPSTDQKHYNRLGRLMTRLREAGVVSFAWIVDNLRSTQKPSSWSGLNEYADTVRQCYRKDFWAQLPNYVHIFCEKDAVAGTIAPVTNEFDVALSPIRGYASLSYAHQIAEQWDQIDKPIYAYYLGDFDPSGFDLERDMHDKLDRYCHQTFLWERLAVEEDDFEAFELLPLKPKKSDVRYQKFIDAHGSHCAELDALPASELRQRVRDAIVQHIPEETWGRLQAVEKAEKETFNRVLDSLREAS